MRKENKIVTANSIWHKAITLKNSEEITNALARAQNLNIKTSKDTTSLSSHFQGLAI